MSRQSNIRERLLRRSRRGPGRRLAYFALILLGVEIPFSVSIGLRLHLAHGAFGLVVHEATTIGDDVKIFSGVTIGRGDQYLHTSDRLPGGGVNIGHRVVIGSGAKILFKSGQVITIGDGAVIGANAVVVSDVPSAEIWAGAPARRVGHNRAEGAARDSS